MHEFLVVFILVLTSAMVLLNTAAVYFGVQAAYHRGAANALRALAEKLRRRSQ